MTEPTHARYAGERPTLREWYEPRWAEQRRIAIGLLTAGDRDGYEYHWKMAQHVRNEFTEPPPWLAS